MSSRRSFLCLSSAALAGVAVPRVFAQHASQREGMPVFSNASLGAFAQGSLTKAHFQSLIGTPFRIFMEDRKVAGLMLLTVTSPDITQDPAASSKAAAPTRSGRAAAVAMPGALSIAQPGAVSFAVASPVVSEPATASTGASSQNYVGTRAALKRPTPEQCFSVTFSSGKVAIPQDSYVVDHASLGNITLFLVPGKDANGANTATSSFFYL